MHTDSTAVVAEPSVRDGDAGAPAAGRFLWCSDCRAPLRAHYYSLNDERPVCGQCKPAYKARIARGSGPRAMGRAVLYGLGAAVAGAALVGAVALTIGFGRPLCAIAIGYMVAKAVNAATNHYHGRRYQVLAVALTYFAVGLGSLTPVVKAYASLEDAPPPAATAGAGTADGPAGLEDLADLESPADAAGSRTPAGAGGDESQWAARLASGGFLGRVGAVLMLLVTLPLMSLFAYGIQGAVVGVFAFGYGMRKAWELTGRGVAFTVTGPHRIGTGPIAVTR